MVANNSHLYLVPGKAPGATYKVLWYRVYPVSTGLYGSRYYSGVTIKIDILLPGVMDIPAFPHEDIIRITNFPVAPFKLVLLLKLQAWSQHRSDYRSYMRIKSYVDHPDLIALFRAAKQKDSKILPLTNGEIYLTALVKASSTCARAYNPISRVQKRLEPTWFQI